MMIFFGLSSYELKLVPMSPDLWKPPAWQGGLIIACCLMLILGLMWLGYKRYKKRHSSFKKPSYKEILEHYRTKIRAIPCDQDTATTATACSGLIRQCLNELFDDPLLYATHEEWHQSSHVQTKLPPHFQPSYWKQLEWLRSHQYQNTTDLGTSQQLIHSSDEFLELLTTYSSP